MNLPVQQPARAVDIVTDSNGVQHHLTVTPLVAAIWYALDGWVK